MGNRDEFRDESLKLWAGLMNDLFPMGRPKSAKWTDIKAMSTVLNKVGSLSDFNHMFYPTGGGMDLEGAEPFSEESGCLALKTGNRVYEVVKPSALLFESVGSEVEWAYFRLECEPMEPCGVYEDEDDDTEEEGEDEEDRSPVDREEVVLVAPGVYAPRSAWDANEFEGEPLPDDSQLIIRSLGGGPFVIFSKGSLYNLGRSGNFDAYSATHAKMNATQFKELIEKFAGVS